MVLRPALGRAKSGGEAALRVGPRGPPARGRVPQAAASHRGGRNRRATKTVAAGARPGCRPRARAGQPLGAIQLLSGANAGKELELTKPLTTLGKPGVQVAVLTRRPQGYFITHVEGAARPNVNGQQFGPRRTRSRITTSSSSPASRWNSSSRLEALRQHLARIAMGLAIVLLFLVHAAQKYPTADGRLPFHDAARQLHLRHPARLAMPRGVDPSVVILDIDERSLGEVGHWPWSRDRWPS